MCVPVMGRDHVSGPWHHNRLLRGHGTQRLTFAVDLLADTADPLVLDGAVTTVDVEERVGQGVDAAEDNQAASDEASGSLGHLGRASSHATGAAAGLLHLAQAPHGLFLPVLRVGHAGGEGESDVGR